MQRHFFRLLQGGSKVLNEISFFSSRPFYNFSSPLRRQIKCSFYKLRWSTLQAYIHIYIPTSRPTYIGEQLILFKMSINFNPQWREIIQEIGAKKKLAYLRRSGPTTVRWDRAISLRGGCGFPIKRQFLVWKIWRNLISCLADYTYTRLVAAECANAGTHPRPLTLPVP